MLTENVLGHGQGYIRIVEHWGDGDACEAEAGIIEAARQSTQGGFVSWDPYEGHPKGDAGLLAYLYREQHSTPFEFAGVVIEVEAPIFVFREWHRHRTQGYSEASARYAPLPAHDYLPEMDRLLFGAQARTNRQASGEALPKNVAEAVRMAIAEHSDATERLYQSMLKAGVAREIARTVLPVGRFSRMRATANLRNWIGFLMLRTAPNAQWEIRQYADALARMLATKFPRTMALAFPDLAASG